MFLQQLQALKQIDNSQEIDLHLCTFVYNQTKNLDITTRICLSLSSLVLFQQQRLGHSALSFIDAYHAVKEYYSLLQIQHIEKPPENINHWLQLLTKSSWGAYIDSNLTPYQQPIILYKKPQLIALQKNFSLEQLIAEKLCTIMNNAITPPSQYSPPKDLIDSTLDQQQLNASIQSIANPLSIITGGPGSGKTTIVFHIISILLSTPQNNEPSNQPRIAIAAPTGKAAARINQSIQQHITSLQNNHRQLSSAFQGLNLKAQTIHRLLGYSERNYRFRYNQQRKLAINILIIDEVSMLDFKLFAALLQALNPNCKLILLGDRHQLPAVEMGDVLGALLDSGFNDIVYNLEKQYRFDNGSSIYRFIKLLNTFKTTAELQSFISQQHDQSFNFFELSASTPTVIFQQLFRYIDNYMLIINDPNASLNDKVAALNLFKIICPFSDNELGTKNINSTIDNYLYKNSDQKDLSDPSLYAGRIIMVTKNDYSLELYNGDIGLVLFDRESSSYQAYFPDQHSTFKKIRLNTLKNLESAFAITVHKSQGSEFEHVFYILTPPNSAQQSQLLDNKLVYTGASRARTQLSLVADLNTLLTASAKHNTSSSCLTHLLIDRGK